MRQLKESEMCCVAGLRIEQDVINKLLFGQKLLQQSKLKNVLSAATYILEKVINAIWPIYNRAIIYCWKGSAEAKRNVENVLFHSNNRGYQSELKKVGLAND